MRTRNPITNPLRNTTGQPIILGPPLITRNMKTTQMLTRRVIIKRGSMVNITHPCGSCAITTNTSHVNIRTEDLLTKKLFIVIMPDSPPNTIRVRVPHLDTIIYIPLTISLVPTSVIMRHPRLRINHHRIHPIRTIQPPPIPPQSNPPPPITFTNFSIEGGLVISLLPALTRRIPHRGRCHHKINIGIRVQKLNTTELIPTQRPLKINPPRPRHPTPITRLFRELENLLHPRILHLVHQISVRANPLVLHTILMPRPPPQIPLQLATSRTHQRETDPRATPRNRQHILITSRLGKNRAQGMLINLRTTNTQPRKTPSTRHISINRLPHITNPHTDRIPSNLRDPPTPTRIIRQRKLFTLKNPSRLLIKTISIQTLRTNHFRHHSRLTRHRNKRIRLTHKITNHRLLPQRNLRYYRLLQRQNHRNQISGPISTRLAILHHRTKQYKRNNKTHNNNKPRTSTQHRGPPFEQNTTPHHARPRTNLALPKNL